MSQSEIVLKHLREQGGITPLDAIANYGITRLASIICRLRIRGYDIHSEIVEGENRYGGKTRFATYYLWEK